MSVARSTSGSSADPARNAERPGPRGTSRSLWSSGCRMFASMRSTSPVPSWASAMARFVARVVLPSPASGDVTITVRAGRSPAA